MLIYDRLRLQDITEILNDLAKFKTQLCDWMKLFLSLYQTKHVTPYMHALAQHVPEAVALHGRLSLFNQQGLEKLNQNQTKDFYRSTNYRGTEAMLMLLQKKNKVEELRDSGYERERKLFRSVKIVSRQGIT